MCCGSPRGLAYGLSIVMATQRNADIWEGIYMHEPLGAGD